MMTNVQPMRNETDAQQCVPGFVKMNGHCILEESAGIDQIAGKRSVQYLELRPKQRKTSAPGDHWNQLGNQQKHQQERNRSQGDGSAGVANGIADLLSVGVA